MQNMLPDYKGNPVVVDPVCEPMLSELERALIQADEAQRNRLLGQLGRLANQLADGRQVAIRDPNLKHAFLEQVGELRKRPVN
jgi:hypothetical protein